VLNIVVFGEPRWNSYMSQ